MPKFWIMVGMLGPKSQLTGFVRQLVFWFSSLRWALDMRFRPSIHCFLGHSATRHGLLTGLCQRRMLQLMSSFEGIAIVESCVNLVNLWCAMWLIQRNVKVMLDGGKVCFLENLSPMICIWFIVKEMWDWLVLSSLFTRTGVNIWVSTERW